MTTAGRQFTKSSNILKLWIVSLVVLIGAGIFGAWEFIGRSETASIPWGLLVPSYVFFSLAAAGSTLIASIATTFQVERFNPIIKRGIWLSLVLIIPAELFVMLDLGKTTQAYNIYFSFHETSRLAWMGILYMVFIIGLVIQLVMAIRQKAFPRWAYIGVAAAVFLIALAVETNLGALFGAVSSKPLWNNPILPLHFIVTALMAGACVHILFTSASRRRGDMPNETAGLFKRDYRPLLAGLVLINFAVIAIKFIPELMSAEAAPYVKLFLTGPYAATFWGLEIAVGGLIPLAILFSRKGKSVGWLSAASAMILVGIFFSKYDLIIGGQSLGPTFTSSFISYFPSVYEILTLVGGLALSLLVYTIGHYILPLEPEKQADWFIFSRTPAPGKKLAHES